MAKYAGYKEPLLRPVRISPVTGTIQPKWRLRPVMVGRFGSGVHEAISGREQGHPIGEVAPRQLLFIGEAVPNAARQVSKESVGRGPRCVHRIGQLARYQNGNADPALDRRLTVRRLIADCRLKFYWIRIGSCRVRCLPGSDLDWTEASWTAGQIIASG